MRRLPLARFGRPQRPRRRAARTIVDAVVLWPHCPRRACRRARRCVDPHVRCFFLHHEAMREVVYPMLRDIAARRATQQANEASADGAATG